MKLKFLYSTVSSLKSIFWDGRDHFSNLQFLLPLLDICIGSWMLRYWQAAFFVCDVLRIVLRLVSVAVLWFALPAIGYALLLPAVGSVLSVLFVILRIFNVLLAVLVLLLLYFILLAANSLAVIPSNILTTGSLAVVPSLVSLAVVPSVLLLQSHFVVVHDSVVRFWLHPTPLLSIAPLRD